MKKYDNGGKVDYAGDLADFVRKNRGRDVSFKDMTKEDVARIPKEAGLAMLAGYGTPFADMASGVVNTVKGLKSDAETRQKLKNLPEEFSESVDMSPPRAPRRELNADQMRGLAKEQALKERYGPSQIERDRSGSGYKKGGKVKKYSKSGSVSSASKRADGIATKGKTKGRMI